MSVMQDDRNSGMLIAVAFELKLFNAIALLRGIGLCIEVQGHIWIIDDTHHTQEDQLLVSRWAA